MKPVTPQIQFGRPLNRGLVSAWLFTEANGTRISDFGGNQRDLSFSAAPVWKFGYNGPAINLSSTQSANKTSFPYYPELTFLARVRRRTISQIFSGIGAHHGGSGVASDWFIYFGDDNKIHIDIPWVAGDVIVSGSTVTDTTQEHVIGFTRSGSAGSWTYKICIDGKLDASGTTASNPVNSAWTFSLGQPFGANPINTDFMEARLWSRALSPSEMLAVYNTDYSEFRPPRRVVAFETAGSAITGTGVLEAQSATLAGVSVSASVGLGALIVQSSAIVGTGTAEWIGTGTLSSQSATITATGASASSGSGVLDVQSAVLSGVGSAEWVGSGSFTAQSASLSAVGLSASTGTGTLAANPATISGLGISASLGSGVLLSGPATVAGLGGDVVVGSGDLVAQSAEITGIGLSSSLGSGTLGANAATLDGLGLSVSLGIGALGAQSATIVAVGASSSTGSGGLEAQAATMNGTDVTLEDSIVLPYVRKTSAARFVRKVPASRYILKVAA